MKRIAICLLLPLWPIATLGQGVEVPGFGKTEAAKAAGIGLVGPNEAKVGEEVVLRMTGTPALDLTKPLTEQLGWLMGKDRMFCYVAAPGRPLLPLDVRGELVFGTAGATMQPLLRIECQAAGEFRILVDWNHGQNQLTEHRIAVGGPLPDPTPGPTPEPNPSPGPIPPGERFVLILHESKDRSPKIATVLASLQNYLDTEYQEFRILDKNEASASNWTKLYTQTLKDRGITLPAVLVAVPQLNNDEWDHSDAFVISADSLPPRTPEALALVKEALNR
jgi:hypothetical protein